MRSNFMGPIVASPLVSIRICLDPWLAAEVIDDSVDQSFIQRMLIVEMVGKKNAEFLTHHVGLVRHCIPFKNQELSVVKVPPWNSPSSKEHIIVPSP